MGRRFFRHGELPLVLLALLLERPMHGYDLMAELGRLFAPHYRPSPGSVYPAVEALEAEGLIEARDVDGRRVYGLTPLGETAIQQRRDTLAALEVRTGTRLGQRRTVDAVLERFASSVRDFADRVDPESLEGVLDRTLADIQRATVQRSRATRG